MLDTQPIPLSRLIAGEADSDPDTGLIPTTVRELRLLRGTFVQPPRRDRAPTGCTGRSGDDTSNTAAVKPADAGTPTLRQHCDHNELQQT